MAKGENLNVQHFFSQRDFDNVKDILKQYFQLKRCIPEFLDFNEKLEPYTYHFLDEKNDEQTIVHYHFYKSTYEFAKLRSTRATEHLNKAAVYSDTLQHPAYKSFYFYIKASIYWVKMDYENAIKYSFKALKNLDILKSKSLQAFKLEAKIYANLNNYYFQINEYEKSFTYYHKAIALAQKYNFIEDLTFLILNFIAHNIDLENHNLVKKEKAFFDKIASTSTSKTLLDSHAIAEIDCAFFFNRSIDYKEMLIKKHQKRLLHTNCPYIQVNYIILHINLLIDKNEIEQAFKKCELLNESFGDKPKFIYLLLLFLSWICVEEESYIKRIESSGKFNNLTINGDLEQLLNLLLTESKNHSKAHQISTLNFIIAYYQKTGNYRKAFEYSSACLSQLKNFSFENIHKEFKNTIDQLENKQKIEEQNNLLAQQEKLTLYFKEFAYTAAHDLKSPLLTIKKFAEIIKASYNNVDNDKAKEYLEIIVETSQRMDTFIKEMIEQHSKERYQKKLEIIDLDEIIGSVKQNLQIPIEQSNCEILCNYNISKVYAIKTHLEILFQNFISNAIKYCRTDAQPIIKIDYTNEGIFSITDNGIGIEEKMAEKIFKPFFQSNDKFIGSGIGLATCKKIIDNFGGEVWVDSELGKGSTFYFTVTPNALK